MARLSPSSTLFGRRLREARQKAGIPQDKLGVSIGIDECSSSARISRYETGVHEPSLQIARLLARVLELPTAYFYCDDDQLADLLAAYWQLDGGKQTKVKELVEKLSTSV